jgi:hypothetical protein
VHRDLLPCIVTCYRASWHVTVQRDLLPCIVTCYRASWHVTVHRDLLPCIVTCDSASWHVTVHRDMWQCIVTCDRASWRGTVHRDVWPCIVTCDKCIVTCDRASWHVTVHRDMWPRIVTNFFIIKPKRCTNFTNLFCHETLHVSDSSSVNHREFIHCTLSNGICHTAFEPDQDGTAVPSWSGSKAVYKPVWHIPSLGVQWITPDDGHRNCPKQVEFHVPSWSCSKAVWYIPLLSVQWINSWWWWTEELPETCRVSCQNKFVKLVHLVGLL